MKLSRIRLNLVPWHNLPPNTVQVSSVLPPTSIYLLIPSILSNSTPTSIYTQSLATCLKFTPYLNLSLTQCILFNYISYCNLSIYPQSLQTCSKFTPYLNLSITECIFFNYISYFNPHLEELKTVTAHYRYRINCFHNYFFYFNPHLEELKIALGGIENRYRKLPLPH